MPEKKSPLILRNDKKILTNKEIVDEFINDGLIERCIEFQFQKLARTDPWKMQYKEDMLQDLIIVLYEYDNEKLNNAYENKHMNALITRIIQNNIYSKTSKFYHNYLRFDNQTSELNEGTYGENYE